MLLLLVLAADPGATIRLRDEGGPAKAVRELNFTGAGVTCSATSTFGTCTIPGGGGAAPAACTAGQAVTSTGAALVCTSVLTASDVACAGTCVSDAEISAVAGAKVTGSVSTADGLTSNPADCSAGQYATTISDRGDLTCAQVAFSQLSGTATDAQLASNYSGVGVCGANTWASTLNDNAAPTCTQPAFSNLSGTVGNSQISDVATTKLTGTVTMAQLGTSNSSGNAQTFLRGDGVWAQYPPRTLTSVLAAQTNPFLPTCNAVRRFNCRIPKGLTP